MPNNSSELCSQAGLENERAALEAKDGSTYLLLIGSIGTMQLSTNYVFDHMEVGYALSLFQLSIIVNVLLGHRFFGEKTSAKNSSARRL